MGADELQRERVIGQVAQQRIELVAVQPGIGEGKAAAPQDAREQPQAVGAGQAFQLVPLRAGQAGVARTAGDEETASTSRTIRTAREIAEQLGEAVALVVGVGAAVGGSPTSTASPAAVAKPRGWGGVSA
jgi:hypothetical protein